MTLFDVVFSGNDTVYGLTEGAIDAAIEKHGADKAIAFPDTAYSLPCYYAVTGTKVATLGQLKEALGVVKTLMTREQKLNDAFTVATVPPSAISSWILAKMMTLASTAIPMERMMPAIPGSVRVRA